MSAPPKEHAISLKGSADLVVEFFAYGVNALLYQRGIYSPASFARVQKYGMTMLMSTDAGVKAFIDSVLQQMRIWITRSVLRRVVVVIASVATGTVLERWAFDVGLVLTEGQGEASTKDERKILGEIQAVIRQITASVSFLPLLDEACSFDMLLYTAEDAETPAKWVESGPRTIKNKDEVRLRSFSTSIHNVDASVTYARCDD